MKLATLRTTASVLAALFLVSCRSLGPAWRDAGLSRRLKAVSAYEYGTDRAPLVALSDFLTDHGSAEARVLFEPQLVELALNTAATRAGRQHAIRELGRVGTAASAPALAGLLGDAQFADDAAMALQRMSDPEVNGILRSALAAGTPTVRARILTVLGKRGDAGAVGIIAPLVRDNDEEVARATVAALGQLATQEAATALVKALPGLRDTVQTTAWDALLACQAAALTRDDSSTVRSITALLETAKAPAHVRAAATLAAWQTASPKGAAGEAAKRMASRDPALQAAGAGIARRRSDRRSLAGLVPSLKSLPAAAQIALMGLLEDAGVTEAAAAVASMVSSTNAVTQRAAIKALRSTGTSDSVELLAKSAADGPEENRKVARASLRLLSGAGVDARIISLSGEMATPERIELLQSMGDRGMTVALPTLFMATEDKEAAIREAAIPQIGTLARSKEWPSLLDLISEQNSEKERQLLITAAAAAGKRIPNSGEALATRLGTAPAKSSRVALIAIAGRLTDGTTLTELIRAVACEDVEVRHAALRTLGNWKDISAFLPLKVAATDSDAQSRRIAQRGAVLVIKQSEGLDEDARVGHYIEIGKCIENAEELRLLLSAVGELKDARAFEIAALFLGHAEVGPEAEAAIIRIAKQQAKITRPVKDVLERVAASSESEPMRNEANALLGR